MVAAINHFLKIEQHENSLWPLKGQETDLSIDIFHCLHSDNKVCNFMVLYSILLYFNQPNYHPIYSAIGKVVKRVVDGASKCTCTPIICSILLNLGFDEPLGS